jgi:hypothetical protein
MAEKKYELTDEHRAQLEPWAKKWIANALRTGAYSADEIKRTRSAVKGLYKAANLQPPEAIAFADSPVAGAFASGFASGAWWIRANQDKHVGTFGSKIGEPVIAASLAAACERADSRAGISARPTIAAAMVAAKLSKRAAKDEPNDKVVEFMFRCAARWSSLYNGGNAWSGWPAFLSFFRHVAKLKIDYSKWKHYEALAEVGPRFVHEKFVVICARPDVLMVDGNMPHCGTGPSHRWPDGRELYYWRGIQVPREWITSPDSVDPTIALTHENAELRRCAAEIIGYERVISRLNPITIHKDPNPEIGEVVEVDILGSRERFLRVLCATGRWFSMPIPIDAATARQAQNWMWQVDDYSPEVCT